MPDNSFWNAFTVIGLIGMCSLIPIAVAIVFTIVKRGARDRRRQVASQRSQAQPQPMRRYYARVRIAGGGDSSGETHLSSQGTTKAASGDVADSVGLMSDSYNPSTFAKVFERFHLLQALSRSSVPETSESVYDSLHGPEKKSKPAMTKDQRRGSLQEVDLGSVSVLPRDVV